MTISLQTPSGDAENLGRYLYCDICSMMSAPSFHYEWCKHMSAIIKAEGKPEKDFLNFEIQDSLETTISLKPSNIYAIYLPMGMAEPIKEMPHIGWCAIDVAPSAVEGFSTVTLVKGSSYKSPKLDEELGLISGTEGRLVVSRMIAEWIMSQCADGEKWGGPVLTRCRSGIHSYVHQRELQNRFSAPEKFPHLVSLTLDGMCIPCQRETFTSDNYGLDAMDDGDTASPYSRFTGNRINRDGNPNLQAMRNPRRRR